MKKKTIVIFMIIFLSFLIWFLSEETKKNQFIETEVNVSTESTMQGMSVNVDSTLVYNRNEIDSGEEIGKNIVDSIESYFQMNQAYPESLEDLVPEFISEIPTTITNRPYIFRVYEADVFVLSFSLATKNDQYSCSYIKRLEVWECSGIGF